MNTTRRTTLGFILPLVFLTAACSDWGAGSKTPNVVLIVVDTLRADSILDPENLVDTPNIDSLARDGIQFEKAFCHAPITLPAHTALFSAREPAATGILNNGQDVSATLPLFTASLADAGYSTQAVISLATLKKNGKRGGIGRSFEKFDQDFQQMAQADQVTTRILSALEELSEDQPFFLFAHLSDPHEPYNSHDVDRRKAKLLLDDEEVGEVLTSDMEIWSEPLVFSPGEHIFELRSDRPFSVRLLKVVSPELSVEWIFARRLKVTRRARIRIVNSTGQSVSSQMKIWASDFVPLEQKRERYVREVEYADKHIGRFLDDLRERGLYDDSLIIFTSDHGEGLGEFGHVGHVHYLYDPYIQIPLIVKLPAGHLRLDELRNRSGHLARHIDVVPTLLELLELRALPGQTGVSLFTAEREPLLAETHKPQANANRLCLRDEQFKMIYSADEDSFQMFDLESDPAELVDVFESRAAERPNWKDRLVAFAKLTAGGSLNADDLTDAQRAELDALGYAAGDS